MRGEFILIIYFVFCVVENENLLFVVVYVNNEFVYVNFVSWEKIVDVFVFGVIDMMLKYLFYCWGFV